MAFLSLVTSSRDNAAKRNNRAYLFAGTALALCLSMEVRAENAGEIDAPPAPVSYTLALPAQQLADSLRALGSAAGVDVAFRPDLVAKKRAPAIHGPLSIEEAFRQLLVGTGLSARNNGRGWYIVANEAHAESIVRVAAAGNIAAVSAARQASSAAAAIEEIVVTGSRIIREGYEAPTPLTVLSAQDIEKTADFSILNTLATVPAVTAFTSGTAMSGSGGGTQGIQSLNLRALGPNRVLVLFDGTRMSPSTYANFVDVTTIPAQLVSRVDIVTGGASAVYGSDAISGVVNFVLDRNFTGVKGEISGGLTNYGDEKNYKINLTGGFGFADDRGHVLVSGEHMFMGGIHGDGGRQWNQNGALFFPNPAYTATNGQNQFFFLADSAIASLAPGGLIVSGPLKGTAFGAGGTPYKFNYGPILSGNIMSGGGDWQQNDIRRLNDMDPAQANDNLFLRVSYDVTDNIRAYVQESYSSNKTHSNGFVQYIAGSATAYVINNDNAFLPASVNAAMAATGTTQFGIGSWNQDMGDVHFATDRHTNRVTAGLEGSYSLFNFTWQWNAYFAYGATHLSVHSDAFLPTRLRLAIDAVVNPENGQIVCRSTLTVDPNNGCRPWNIMGVGVNAGNSAGRTYITAGGSYQQGLIKQQTWAASTSGDIFSLWAGPVSLAVSLEHRTDETNAVSDPFSSTGQRWSTNFASLAGKQSVTEGALEALIPLAKDETWAKNWDLSIAGRFTGYTQAGFATTYKFGTTYTPIDDIKFRVTRSRDIRAPNIQDLYSKGSTGLASGLNDLITGLPTPTTTQQVVQGNPNLHPEKADTTGFGIILQPRFLEGFTVSADFWSVEIHDAIQLLSAQQIIDTCFGGLAQACASITRNPDNTVRTIFTNPVNLALYDTRGIDLEATYRMPMSRIISSWRGNFLLHGNMTFYIKAFQNSGVSPPTDVSGQYWFNSGTPTQLPKWKINVTGTYQLDPISVSLTGRGIPDGTLGHDFIACTSACPTSTVVNQTWNTNTIPGRFYMDANVNYKFSVGEEAVAEAFFSIRNIFNEDVPSMPTSVPLYSYSLTTGSLFDSYGTIFRAGVRFKM